MIEILLYAICARYVTFAVSGLNLNGSFKHGHVWEARIFLCIIIACLTHILEQFLINIINII